MSKKGKIVTAFSLSCISIGALFLAIGILNNNIQFDFIGEILIVLFATIGAVILDIFLEIYGITDENERSKKQQWVSD